jgi:deoxyribodipyrimidine photo-lyase
MSAPVIVWFRQDLRLSDNPALAEAVASGGVVVPVYILDDTAAGAWAMGGASRWWLERSLAALDAALAAKGSRLILRRGDAADILPALAAESGAATVMWNRRYEPAAIAQDTSIKASLRARGIAVQSFNAALLFEPWRVQTQGGTPFKVFTPFWRACLALGLPDDVYDAPAALAPAPPGLASDPLAAWALYPARPDWAARFGDLWQPGEAGARTRLAAFLDGPVTDYTDGRNRPDRDATSMLSPHLHFGEIGPRQIVRAIRFAADRRPGLQPQTDKFLAEIGWREFSTHLLHQFPALPERCFRPEYEAFPWAANAGALTAWQQGATGVPIVDAGMRQLWIHGWMHNRVRMVVASFLVKHLLIPWQLGAAWFWDTLVDADLANNAASWQWVAGCGADAAPYFRIFNPVLQGERFDPDGNYVRTYVPELARMPARYIHKPWDAPAAVLTAAGIVPGRTYPHRIVDLQQGRDRALAAFDTLKNAA